MAGGKEAMVWQENCWVMVNKIKISTFFFAAQDLYLHGSSKVLETFHVADLNAGSVSEHPL